MIATQDIEKTSLSHQPEIESLIENIEFARHEMKLGFIDFKNELHHQSNRFIAIIAGSMVALAGIIIAAIKLLF